jgi:hypothetical protein
MIKGNQTIRPDLSQNESLPPKAGCERRFIDDGIAWPVNENE